MRDKDLLLSLLKSSVKKCYSNDASLIDRSMEQASVGRIFYYMQEAMSYDKRFTSLKHYDLDIEYNKNGYHIKETSRCQRGTKPDIILHRRQSLDHNLLIVEFKARKSRIRKYKDTGINMDFIKLEDFTSNYKYNYFLGVYVKLNKNNATYKYFQNEEERAENELLDDIN